MLLGRGRCSRSAARTSGARSRRSSLPCARRGRGRRCRACQRIRWRRGTLGARGPGARGSPKGRRGWQPWRHPQPDQIAEAKERRGRVAINCGQRRPLALLREGALTRIANAEAFAKRLSFPGCPCYSPGSPRWARPFPFPGLSMPVGPFAGSAPHVPFFRGETFPPSSSWPARCTLPACPCRW